MTYKEIKRYLYGDCIVRNEEYEYKISHGDSVYCRQIGCETWNYIHSIPDYEKEQEWELVGKRSYSESVNKNIAVIRTCLKTMRAFGNEKSKTDIENALKWFDGQFLYK